MGRTQTENDHCHECPHRSCGKRFGCALEGCKDWDRKVCDKCYEEVHRKGRGRLKDEEQLAKGQAAREKWNKD